jgi:hypothetical protein
MVIIGKLSFKLVVLVSQAAYLASGLGHPLLVVLICLLSSQYLQVILQPWIIQ